MNVVNPLQGDAHEHWHQSVPVPRWKRACRVWYDRTALTLMTADPRNGIVGMGLLGTMARVTGAQGPAPADIQSLFPGMSRRVAASIANRIASAYFRNRAAIALAAQEGVAALAALVEEASAVAPPALTQGRGVLLLTFHLGAHFGVSAGLSRWKRQAVVLRDQPLLDADARARSLKLAVDTANRGGTVMATIDGPGGSSSPPVPCLGRQIVIRRGPLVLARLTGADVVPVVAQWTERGRIRIVTGPSLELPARDDPSFELTAALRTASWLEQHLTLHPADLWPYTLRNFLASPRSGN